MTYIDEICSSEFWPSLEAPFQSLIAAYNDKICWQKSLATLGGSDYLLALAINRPMPSDHF